MLTRNLQETNASLVARIGLTGGGFHVGRGYVITCAHLLNLAAGSDWLSEEPPSRASVAAIRVAFPRSASGQSEFAANLVAWYPARLESARRRDELCDIAVLRIEADPKILPATARPRDRPASTNEPFIAWGFPGDSAGAPRLNGTPAKGEVIDPDLAGFAEVRGTEPREYMLRPGFSGGPAFDSDGRLLGMVTQADPNDLRAVLITSSQIARAWPPFGRPYQGFLAFNEETARYFFGREEETARLEAVLIRQLDRTRVIAVVGASGSGKSSLVHAGLVPRLRAKGWTVISLRPGRDPLLALEAALLPLGVSAPVTLDTLRRVGHAQENRNLVLVVDQFEELYTQTPDEERSNFFNLLFGIANDRRASWVIIIIFRSDLVTPLTFDNRTNQVLEDASFWLGPMTFDALRKAIIEPARVHFGVIYEDGLLDRLVGDALGSTSVEKVSAGRLPLLQFALTQLWEWQEPVAKRISVAAYGDAPAGIGGITGAIERYAAEILATEFAERRERVIKLLARLAARDQGIGDVRRVITRAEIGEPDWREVVLPLAAHRIVITDQWEGVDTVEVVHEAVLRSWPGLTEMLGPQREFYAWRARLTEQVAYWQTATGKERQNSLLLSGPLLRQAISYSEHHRSELSEGIIKFIEESTKVEQERAARVKRAVRLKFEAERLTEVG